MAQQSPAARLPLIGERVRLTALQEADQELLQPFFQDMASLTYYIPTTARPLNGRQLRALLDDWNDGLENFVFAVRTDSRLIGLVNLDGLDWPNSHVELGVALTDPEARGQGLASEALRLLLDFCFAELGLHRVWARIIEGNGPSVRLFESLGFSREGVLREHVRRSDRFRDMLIFSLLRPEWDASKP
ncbi:MAG: GNAT family N-acetyltransferase [Clostridiaceae bacterium]|nr:GNAT family N-acetyltransferase [Clostridiaceae bacterium]